MYGMNIFKITIYVLGLKLDTVIKTKKYSKKNVLASSK